MYESNSYVKVDSKLSESFQQIIGLKQGCVLSPALFNVYFNDLPDLIYNVTETDPVIINGKIISSLLFADDSMLLLSQSAKGLQKGPIMLWTIFLLNIPYVTKG
jgi:hypothetical protein